MPEQQQTSSSGEKKQPPRWQFKQEAFIDQLVPDPAQVPNTQALTGFMGKSTRAGYVRLYLSPALNNYVEIPEEAIQYGEPLAAESAKARLPRSVLWVNAEAKLYHTRIISREVQADFLQGDLTNAFMGGTGLESLFGEGGVQNLLNAMAAPQARATTGTVCKSIAVSLISVLSVVVTTSGTLACTVTVVTV